MTEFLIPAAQVFLAICLILVAVLCLRLDAKLNALRKGKDGVAATARELTQAVARADAAIKALRAHSEEATALLQQRIDEAQAMSDGLKFLTTTARALEPLQTDVRKDRWDEDDFRPARRDTSAPSRWGGLR
jgi:hypothetical protein